jgi:hypothetical protein
MGGPKGQTPVVRQKVTRDHLSVMGGMTPGGKIYTLARQESLNGLHSIEFLKHLLEVAGERLPVIVQSFFAQAGLRIDEA